MKALLGWIFGLFIVCCLFSVDARSEVMTGTVHDTAQLERVRAQWKFKMVSTKRNHDKRSIVSQGVSQGSMSMSRTDVQTKKQMTHGCFIWCVLPGNDKDSIQLKYSYSYGEATADDAAKKAAYAFDSKPGTCERGKPVVEYVRGDDL